MWDKLSAEKMKQLEKKQRNSDAKSCEYRTNNKRMCVKGWWKKAKACGEKKWKSFRNQFLLFAARCILTQCIRGQSRVFILHTKKTAEKQTVR